MKILMELASGVLLLAVLAVMLTACSSPESNSPFMPSLSTVVSLVR